MRSRYLVPRTLNTLNYSKHKTGFSPDAEKRLVATLTDAPHAKKTRALLAAKSAIDDYKELRLDYKQTPSGAQIRDELESLKKQLSALDATIGSVDVVTKDLLSMQPLFHDALLRDAVQDSLEAIRRIESLLRPGTKGAKPDKALFEVVARLTKVFRIYYDRGLPARYLQTRNLSFIETALVDRGVMEPEGGVTDRDNIRTLKRIAPKL